jgi:tRNA-Thr(GGU) m(6)t(6)A37 methyltransferase TsaA
MHHPYVKRQILLIVIAAFYFMRMSGQEIEKNQVIYTPIGIFHTDYTPETGAPRQGILVPEGKGRIEIYTEYQDALKALDQFEYIIVIYHFDKAGKWNPIVRPPGSNPDHIYGLFSTRSPNRPNPIGIATIKLEKIENGILYVSGIDAYDGTPVLDIKPYLPTIDCVESTKNQSIEKDLGLP